MKDDAPARAERDVAVTPTRASRRRAHPLVQLYALRFRRALLGHLVGLGRPRKLLGLIAWSLLLAFAFVQQRLDVTPAAEPYALLHLFLAVLFLIALLSGFTRRGLPLEAPERDFLLALPVSERSLIAYRLARLHPYGILTAICLTALLHHGMTNRVAGFFALLVCHTVYLHVQTGISLWIGRADMTWTARFERPGRALLFVLAIVGFALLPWIQRIDGGFANVVRSTLEHPIARVAFYPAHAAATLACRTRSFEGWPHMLGLGAVAALTFVLVCKLPLSVSENAPVRPRSRHRSRRRRRGRWPVGARSILYKNLLAMGRSWRPLLVGIVFCVCFLVPATMAFPVFPGLSETFVRRSVLPVAMVAAIPMFLQHFVTFDLRRDREWLTCYASLPIPIWKTVLAATLGPVFVTLCVQATALGLFVIGDVAAPAALGIGVVLFPALTLGLHLSCNLAHLLLPPPQLDSELGAFAASGMNANVLLSALANALILIPVLTCGVLSLTLTGQVSIAILVALLVQVLVDTVLVAALGTLVRVEVRRRGR